MAIEFDATLNLNSVVTLAVGVITGLVCYIVKNMEHRLASIEQHEGRMTEALVDIAKSKTELSLLSKRLDEVQQHGSYRLAEILAAIRGQIQADFKERFNSLEAQIRREK